MKPLWIIVDGIDGSGKTTLCKNLETALNLRNDTESIHLPYEYSVYYQDIKEMLKDKEQSNSDKLQYLMIANYRDTLKNFIIPMLSKGTNVVLDRWITSTIAYNLYHQGQLMVELCNLSWMMAYDTAERFISKSKIMNIDIIHNILISGIDTQGYSPDALMYLIPNSSLITSICQKRKEEGSKDNNDVDYVKMAKLNKIFSSMAKMSVTSLPYTNNQGIEINDDIRFDYTKLTKVVGITSEDQGCISEYYSTLFFDAMQVIHQVLELEQSSGFSVEPVDLKNLVECPSIKSSDPYVTFDTPLPSAPSYYYE